MVELNGIEPSRRQALTFEVNVRAETVCGRRRLRVSQRRYAES